MDSRKGLSSKVPAALQAFQAMGLQDRAVKGCSQTILPGWPTTPWGVESWDGLVLEMPCSHDALRHYLRAMSRCWTEPPKTL